MNCSETTPLSTPKVSLRVKRQHITTERKKEIIEAASSKSLTEVSKLFNIPRSTCQSILRNKEAILKALENGIGLKRARLTKGRNTGFDNALLQWTKSLQDEPVLLTPSILREKALELAAEMKVEGFQASNGWLDRFQSRNSISLHRAQNENNELSDETIRAWQERVLHKTLSCFNPEDVFSVDEAELYWQLQPIRNQLEDSAGVKRVKERITVLIGSNMTGSEKLPLFVIGHKSKLNQFESQNVPITYISNERAWMTADIFVNWLNDWDKRLCQADRKVLLYVDRCQAHPKVKLQNIRLKFFLSKMCSSMQPMNQGVVQSFKLQYRRLLLSTSPNNNEVQHQSDTPFLTALHYLHPAWQQVTPITISNCFRKSGFVPQKRTDINLDESDSDDDQFFAESSSQLETVDRLTDTVQSSDNDDSGEEFSTSNAFILAEIAKICGEKGDSQASERVDIKDAVAALNTIRLFVEQHTDDPNLFAVCDILGAFLDTHQ